MGIEFRPIQGDERAKLHEALRGNARDGDPLFMSRKDTGFVASRPDVSDEEVVQAIRSVPTHYSAATVTEALSIRLETADGKLVADDRALPQPMEPLPGVVILSVIPARVFVRVPDTIPPVYREAFWWRLKGRKVDGE